MLLLPPSGPTEIDRMAVPLSPPYSHTDSSKSTQNVNQGETHNSNIQNIGGVIAGNIAGFNNIVGTLNVTVDSAADLTNKIESVTKHAATAAERLKEVEKRIRQTSPLLANPRFGD